MSDLCEKCHERPVEYNSPGNWCGECWAHWWTHAEPGEYSDMSSAEEQEYYEEVMEEIEKVREQERN